MIFETLPFQFDVKKLQDHVREFVLPLPPQMVGSFFGGWSVLSSDGRYQDGWGSGEKSFDPNFMPGATMQEKLDAVGIKPLDAYSHPTEVCHGYLQEVIDTISSWGLNPRRARLSLLRAHGKSTLHRDAPDSKHAVRLHLPIYSNEQCTFRCEEGSAYLPADGHAYLLRVNRMHQVFNESDENRIHLIMAVKDTNGFSQFHRSPKVD